MNKLDMQTTDIVDENIEKIGALFPNVIVESEKGKAVDFNLLKQELSKVAVDESKEKYQLTWPGKKECIITANTPTNKTLRPVKEKSVDFENTKNIYIEGDNLEVLKILQESYLNKIKCIYIDPPYNTGNNIIYKNDYSRDENTENLESGILDEDGYKLVTNTKNNGRFHSDWLSMIYERLKLARNLLSNDGNIIIAIDDNEYHNLKKIADEIFGEACYVGSIVTRCNPQGRGKKNIDPCHEYHIVYAKDTNKMEDLKLNISEDEQGYKNLMRSGTNSRKTERPKRFYPMLVKDEIISCIEYNDYKKIYDEKTKKFDEKFIKEVTLKYEKNGYKVIWPIAKNGEEKVWQRVYERVVDEVKDYIITGNQIKTPSGEDRTPMSLWNDDIYSNVANGTNKLSALFDYNKVFDYSKSIYTVRDLISLGKNDIVLDFFSGSATTAHAVLLLNSQDTNNRRYIMVQAPIVCDDSIQTSNLNLDTICDVGQERIRRAANKIKEETNADIDYGFRVYKVDSSNMKDVYYTADEYKQEQLEMFTTNIKEDRNNNDLLTSVILDLGLSLDLKIEEKTILENKVYFVDENSLVACFDDNINIEIVDNIAKYSPLKVVFRESSFKTDNDKINLMEKFKKLLPETEVTVL